MSADGLTVWQRLERLVDEESDQHELRDPDYTPKGHERMIALDFAIGLLSNDDYLWLIWQAMNERIAGRRSDGECVDCGRSGGGHWGMCSTLRERK